MSTALTIQTLVRAEFACTDASCAPPPVGTGGSVPSASKLRAGKGFGRPSAVPGARTPVSPGRGIDKDAFDLPSRSESLARSVWEHKLPSGASSTVTHVQSRWNGATQTGIMKVKGQIDDSDGNVLATFERDLVYEGDTERLHVKHEYLSTVPGKNNAGIGSEFNSASFNQYRDAGVDYIEVDAGMSVGGYNWAREGFRVEARRNEWTGKMESRHDQIQSMAAYSRDNIERVIGTDPNIPFTQGREMIAESKRRLAAIVSASKAGEDVQPIHIASIGESDMRFQTDKGYETWPGKEMLLGQSWHGIYYFDAAEPVVASATCEHGNLVAACYDASCRPPTSGGTGGSSQRGYGPTSLRDVRLGGVRVTYDPDYPDGGPDPGEIVWAKISFEDDPSQSKDRPVLVVGRVNGSTTLAAVQLTSKIKGRKWELPIGSGSWDKSGRPSALNLSRIVQISADNYRREGSVVRKEAFDAIVGKLSAYHRTPVVVAAASYLEEFKFNPGQPRDHRGRWTRGGLGGSPNLESQRIKCDPPPCINQSIERTGSLARSVLHRRIVKEMLAGGTPPPSVTILGGGGGAGKSTIVNKYGLGKGQAVVNADDIKEKIPEYKALVKAGDMGAAAFVHEESSKIAQDVQAEARQHGVGVLLDQVGANPAKVTSQIKKFVAAGYTDIDAVYVTVPTQVAVDRAKARAERSGRAVPETILRAAHRDVSRGFEEIAALPQLRDVKLYDNTGAEPILIASGGRGRPLVIHEPTLYDQFLAKGNE